MSSIFFNNVMGYYAYARWDKHPKLMPENQILQKYKRIAEDDPSNVTVRR